MWIGEDREGRAGANLPGGVGGVGCGCEVDSSQASVVGAEVGLFRRYFFLISSVFGGCFEEGKAAVESGGHVVEEGISARELGLGHAGFHKADGEGGGAGIG